MPVDAAEARRRVKVLLGAALGRSLSTQDPVVADALLVTSELVTNALRHAGGVTAFEAMADRVGLRLVVEDASPGLPSTKEPSGDFTPGGYGWPMICRLATSVTVSLLPSGGKRIQVFLPL
ncbi:ATP-binding protein [Streptomyces sp. NPDC058301]|uniref:ATP-binding protein n=1 Tax=Streptomyces sp. NPDC058301 TaxID=3346436 RepID=UPI0036E4F33C